MTGSVPRRPGHVRRHTKYRGTSRPCVGLAQVPTFPIALNSATRLTTDRVVPVAASQPRRALRRGTTITTISDLSAESIRRNAIHRTMVHTVTVEERESLPYRTLVRLDITELDEAGIEEFDPTTEHDSQRNINNPSGLVLPTGELAAVDVLEWEDESLMIMWDTVDEELKVKNLDDGTDVSNDTPVGEVLLEVRNT